MSHEIDLTKSVHALCAEHTLLAAQLREIGFDQISPAMLATAGKFVTLPKGAQMKGIPLDFVVKRLQEYGYTVTNIP